MKLDVKKLTREELENLLVALTFDKSFDTYSEPSWSAHTNPDRPRITNDVFNVASAIWNGKMIQEILAIFEKNPTKEFRCKDLGEMINKSYQSVAYIIKRLYAKGFLERIVKEEIAIIPYYEWDYKRHKDIALMKQALVDVAYYKLAEGV